MHFWEVVRDENDVVSPDEAVAFSTFYVVSGSFFSPLGDGFAVYVVYDGVEFVWCACSSLPTSLCEGDLVCVDGVSDVQFGGFVCVV